MDRPRGWSVFVVDPGETTGWVWACIGYNELRSGAADAVVKASAHRSGVQLADSRFQWGQVEGQYRSGEFYEAEHRMAYDTYIEMMRCGNLGRRTSGGAVPEISDVIIEDFTLRERTKRRDLLSPIRVTAHLQSIMMMSKHELPPIHLQSASDKSAITDDRLKHWGLWVPGKPHAMDALRHLIVWLRTKEKEHGFSL